MITPRVQELLDAFDAGRDSFAEAYDRLKCTSEEFHALLLAIAPGATIEERCRLLRSLGSEDPTAFVGGAAAAEWESPRLTGDYSRQSCHF